MDLTYSAILAHRKPQSGATPMGLSAWEKAIEIDLEQRLSRCASAKNYSGGDISPPLMSFAGFSTSLTKRLGTCFCNPTRRIGAHDAHGDYVLDVSRRLPNRKTSDRVLVNANPDPHDGRSESGETSDLKRG